MDEKKQTGFTLFPTPPTPPAKRGRTSTLTTSSSSTKLTKSRPQGHGHGRKGSKCVSEEISQPGLIPAPLKIKRVEEEIPPVPTLLPPFPPTTPTRTKKELAAPPKTPESCAPQLPAIPQSSPLSALPQTPSRHGRLKSRVIAEFIELEAASRKRASSRLSQWLDLEDGEVDRKRLSKYLGSVLDNTFEVPNLAGSTPRGSLALLRRVSRLELKALVEQCECPPGAVICHCSSSPEFERFRSWSHHQKNVSISSTACLVGVPRARFQSAFFALTEPDIAELPSPPGLSYDEGDGDEAAEWGTPQTPSKDDVFSLPSASTRSYSSKYVVPSPLSTRSSSSKYQSFSRPFRPDSSYQCMNSGSSTPSTPSRSRSPKSGFLTSISTMSSFDFNFDIKARCESLAFQQKLDFETLPLPSVGREISNHLRSDSNESFNSQASQTSQYELNTATAMSGSSIKPVLITNTPKKTRIPSNGRIHSSYTHTSSAKTSTSSVSIPEYWRQFDAGVQPMRSRSTTIGSNATGESTALSALLTMPLLCPKLKVPENKMVAGNAFAQRSNTIAAMPSTVPRDEFRQFSFGINDTTAENVLNRSKTAPSMTSHISSPKPRPSTSIIHVDTQQPVSPTPMECTAVPKSLTSSPVVHTPISSPVTPSQDTLASIPQDVNDHVQAHANASARLRAFMNGGVDPSTSTTLVDISTGLERKKSSHRGTRRKKKYICTDETVNNRDDSGVFGRMSVIGFNMGAVPGRREFSEPHFYRDA